MRVPFLPRVIAIVFTGVLGAVLGGCYSMRADLPGTWRPATPNEDVVIVGRVDREATYWFLLYGLAPSPPSTLYAEPMLRAVEAAGGDGVANVVLDTHFTAADVAWRTFTLGLVSPRTYRVRADIVRLPGPPPPGRPLLRARAPRVAPPRAPVAPVAPRTPAPPELVAPPEPMAPVVPPEPVAPREPVDPSAPPPMLGTP